MEKPFDESWFLVPLEAVGDVAELPAEEAHHLRHVLRIRSGRPIVATNGKGRVFLCETEDRHGMVVAKAAEILMDRPAPPRLHIVMGLLKGRDTEDPVEGLCQLHIADIHLVITEHTQSFQGQDHTRLLERLNQKSKVALKQAKKPWLTAIHPPKTLSAWTMTHPGEMILVHPGPDRMAGLGSGSLYLLTGPEGGFSQAELKIFEDDPAAFRLGLGDSRIRAAHAPLLACGKLMGLGLI